MPSEIRKTPIPISGDGADFSQLDLDLRNGKPIQEILKQQNESTALSTGIDRDALLLLEGARQKMVARRTRRTY